MPGLLNRPVTGLGGYAALALGLGAAAGVAWERVVDLPGYRVAADGGAATSERALAEFLAADAWFCVLGAGLGLLLGVLAWWRLRGLGWPVVPLVAVAALAAAGVCWLVGAQLGPGEFAPRLAAARAGDLVPVELTLRARASLLVWPFFAVLPVLLGSALGRDEEEAADEAAAGRVAVNGSGGPPPEPAPRW